LEQSTLQNERPVFVCGTSRSGTNLVSSTLREQTEYAVCGETHYFDDLRVRMADHLGAELGEEQKKVCEDYFLALTHRPYGHQGDPEQASMCRVEFREAAESLGGCPDAYFMAYCLIQMREHGGTLWGEKTPRHAFRIDDMLDLFPGGKVIYMLRDPRGVVASYRDWRNQGGFDLESDPDHVPVLEDEHRRTRSSYHPVIITLLWKAALRAARSAVENFGPDRVRIVRYEEICNAPDETFNGICEWIGSGERVDVSKLTVQNSSYESYERKGGVKTGAATRWKTKLTPREIALIEYTSGSMLTAAGYEPMRPAVSRLRLVADLASAGPVLVRATLANASRSGNLPRYILRRARLAFG